MNDRQKKVLKRIVELYTETAVPVSSSTLLERYKLGVSSATLRNDMAALEEEGYLHQPHTSAGRIPTDMGYRHYVEEEMGERELSREEQLRLKQELLQRRAREARFARTTARLLSHFSGNLAVSGLPERNEFYDFGMRELLENPEFQELDELCKLTEALDLIDEKFELLVRELRDGETRIFIGEENPIAEVRSGAMVVSPYRTRDGERGILAIIGPKRMEYAKNKSLLEFVKKLLSSSAVIVLFVNVL